MKKIILAAVFCFVSTSSFAGIVGLATDARINEITIDTDAQSVKMKIEGVIDGKFDSEETINLNLSTLYGREKVFTGYRYDIKVIPHNGSALFYVMSRGSTKILTSAVRTLSPKYHLPLNISDVEIEITQATASHRSPRTGLVLESQWVSGKILDKDNDRTLCGFQFSTSKNNFDNQTIDNCGGLLQGTFSIERGAYTGDWNGDYYPTVLNTKINLKDSKNTAPVEIKTEFNMSVTVTRGRNG